MLANICRHFTFYTNMAQYHIKKLKFKYAGNMAMRDKNKWNLSVTQWISRDHKRHIGRPPTTWVDKLIRYVDPH